MQFILRCGLRHSSDVFYLLGVGADTISGVCRSEEADSVGLDLTFRTVENQSVLFGSMHELGQISVMLLFCLANNRYVVCYTDAPWEAFSDAVHVLLEQILADGKTKWKAPVAIATEGSAERSEFL